MPEFPAADTLAIAAHRDNAEQTCRGTLLKMAVRGLRTAILVCGPGSATANPFVQMEAGLVDGLTLLPVQSL